MGLIQKMGSGLKKMGSGLKGCFTGTAPRWALTSALTVSILLTSAIGTIHGIKHWGNDDSSTTYKLIESMNDEMRKLKYELSIRYGSTITDIISVTPTKGAQNSVMGTLDIIATAKTTKGKVHYVNFTFDVANDRLEVIGTYETDATTALDNYDKNSEEKESEKLAEAATTAILNYVSEITANVKSYTSKVDIQSVELGEVLQQTIIEDGSEKTSNYTGKGMLELAYKHLANQGLASKEKTDALYEQIKPVFTDKNIKLETSISIDIENSRTTISTKVANTVHILNINISSIVASTSDPAEIKKQATEYVLKLLKATEEGTLTTEQLKSVKEYTLADTISNRIFTVVNQLANKKHKISTDITV